MEDLINISLETDTLTDENVTALTKGQLYDFITNKPVMNWPAERTLKTITSPDLDSVGRQAGCIASGHN